MLTSLWPRPDSLSSHPVHLLEATAGIPRPEPLSEWLSEGKVDAGCTDLIPGARWAVSWVPMGSVLQLKEAALNQHSNLGAGLLTRSVGSPGANSRWQCTPGVGRWVQGQVL